MYGKTLRKSFARVPEVQEMPHLLEVQRNSYHWFLEQGLREVFDEVDSVTDYSGNLELSFVGYSINEKPKYSEQECKARDATYAAPLKVSVRLRNRRGAPSSSTGPSASSSPRSSAPPASISTRPRTRP